MDFEKEFFKLLASSKAKGIIQETIEERMNREKETIQR